MDPYDRVIAALKAHGSRFAGGNWQCPAHDDRTPSLSVNPKLHPETREPTVVLNCHAGCSTIDEILPALGLQLSDLFAGNGQAALFPKSKYSPVGIEIVRWLPKGSVQTFWVASALGRYVDGLGTRRRVARQAEIAAVLLELKHRRAVADLCKISPANFRNHVAEWQDLGVAHKCSSAILVLFVRPENACPVCKAQLSGALQATKAQPHGGVQGARMQPHGGASTHETETTMPGFFKEVDGSSSDLGMKGAFGRDRSGVRAIAGAIRPTRVITNHKELREALDRDYRESKGGPRA
jgi:hypothetical protein